MIWLTWRQYRVQALVVTAIVVAFAAVLLCTGPQLARLADESGNSFLAQASVGGTDPTVYRVGIGLLYLLPGAVGLFWGAPLVARELEASTYRLTWSQSVTRTRWLAVKLGVSALAAAVLAGIVGVGFTWWASPIDTDLDKGLTAGAFSMPRLSPLVFGAHGIVPVGYAVFALALGVAVGLVLRRSIPAMAVTLVLLAAAQVGTPLWVRPHLIEPVRYTTTITAANLGRIVAQPGGRVIDLEVRVHRPGDWILANETVDASGHAVATLPHWVIQCGPPPPGQPDRHQACFARLRRLGYRQRVSYQPASRFWSLQWREAGGYLVIAAALAGFCLWRIRRIR
ncbi:transporter [Actinocatenispora thailandica]|uniref:Transporter n=1 Tax=Actinocatenispora thailandica TaxID=227318 RepID=A0A7R7DMT7_9ACTN|nr:ABC transporter permease subunit [Actinocatenispora thailandica]BCJ34629.1 transporter [Actinocatenispora thailandica]